MHARAITTPRNRNEKRTIAVSICWRQKEDRAIADSFLFLAYLDLTAEFFGKKLLRTSAYDSIARFDGFADKPSVRNWRVRWNFAPREALWIDLHVNPCSTLPPNNCGARYDHARLRLAVRQERCRCQAREKPSLLTRGHVKENAALESRIDTRSPGNKLRWNGISVRAFDHRSVRRIADVNSSRQAHLNEHAAFVNQFFELRCTLHYPTCEMLAPLLAHLALNNTDARRHRYVYSFSHY